MIVVWILNTLVALGSWIIELFPAADTSFITDALAPVGNLVHWIMAVNEYLPLTEGAVMSGVLIAAYVALHGGNAIRRVWSLISGGGGA